jgi:hypothetical protein
MTVHRNRFLVNKTNKCTEFQFYLYYDSTRFGQPFCPSSGVLSRTSALGIFYAVVINRLLPGVGWNCSSILIIQLNAPVAKTLVIHTD